MWIFINRGDLAYSVVLAAGDTFLVLMGKIKIITSKDWDKVLNIQEIQELNVIDLRLSYNLIEVTDDDLVAWLHHLLVMVFESIQVQLQNRLFIQKFADYEFTKILKKLLTA